MKKPTTFTHRIMTNFLWWIFLISSILFLHFIVPMTSQTSLPSEMTSSLNDLTSMIGDFTSTAQTFQNTQDPRITGLNPASSKPPEVHRLGT